METTAIKALPERSLPQVPSFFSRLFEGVDDTVARALEAAGLCPDRPSAEYLRDMSQFPEGLRMVVDDVMERLPPHMRIGGRRCEVEGIVARLVGAASSVPPRSQVEEGTAAA